MPRRALGFAAVAFLSLGSLPQPAAGQETTSQEPPAPETTLRSQSNVVLIPALVKDRQGGLVYGLQVKDFIVEDDGVEQPIRLDEAPEGQTISIVIAIQTGRRANYEFPRIARLNSMIEPIVDGARANHRQVDDLGHEPQQRDRGRVAVD